MNKKQRGVRGILRSYLLTQLRITDQPTVKVYRGFGNAQRIVIHGTVFRRSAFPRKKYRNGWLVNLFSLIRLFAVRPYAGVRVRVGCNQAYTEVITDTTGYFWATLSLNIPLSPGWNPVWARLVPQTSTSETVLAKGNGQVLVPHPTSLACISDIDDTFLISHSANLAKRLRALFTQNAHSRQPFEGVVAHYQLLAKTDSNPEATVPASNAFFYVSSSEWNLYDYILDFSEKNHLPTGVYLLSPLKRFRELLKTGQGKHRTKFDRITWILQTYPDQQFILLGDDTQEDPGIYASVVERFPRQIRVVYIRQVHAKNQPKTHAILDRIDEMGVPYCYFAHSRDALQHTLDNHL